MVKATIADRTITLADIFIGALPFVLVMSVLTILLIGFSSLSLILE